MLHTDYQFRGGEEESLEAEVLCFERLGFSVQLIRLNNASVRPGLRNGLRAFFNPSSFIKVWQTSRRNRPTLIYANNLWPALSPSVLLAARLLRVPTVQALHNYRLIAPSARLDDSGKCIVCHTRRHPFGCIAHGCYRSIVASLTCAVASFLFRVVALGWKGHWYVSPSRKSKDLLTARGVRGQRFLVRSNFLPQAPQVLTRRRKRNVITFVGRLSEEKGIAQLVRAWPSSADFPVLEVVGDGPLRQDLQATVATMSNVGLLGALPPADVLKLMESSLLTVVPSCWAEPFGRVAIESMAVGTPVMTTGHGALAEIVGDAGIILDELASGVIQCAVESATDPKTYQRLSEGSFERYWSMYSMAAAETEMTNILLDMKINH